MTQQMRESYSWQQPASKSKTAEVTFDPVLPTNLALLAVLEKYAHVEGFDNTLARVLIENTSKPDPTPINDNEE